MTYRCLLTPSGVTQLLFQLSSLKTEYPDVKLDCDVLSVCPLFNEAMELAMKDACVSLSCNYLGNFEGLPSIDHLRIRRDFKRLARWVISPIWFWRRAASKVGFPSSRRYDVAVVCVRENNLHEAVAINLMKTHTIICVADGVYTDERCRRKRTIAMRGLAAPFLSLPLDRTVYAPSFLIEDANRIGCAKPYDQTQADEVFEQYQSGRLGRRLAEVVQPVLEVDDSLIVFSQHLALSGHMNSVEEVAFFAEMIDTAIEHGVKSVLFKPHPRDPIAKIEQLQRLCSHASFIPPDLTCVPIEPILQQRHTTQPVGISLNSTALLSYRALTGAEVVSCESPMFTEEFRDEVRDFCVRHSVPLFARYADALTRDSNISTDRKQIA